MTKGIFVGLATVDVVYGVDEFPSANSKVAARSQDVFVGGPATNASIAFGHLGGRPTLVTVVGRHALAGVIMEEFERYSIRLIDLNPGFDKAPVISSISVNGSGERNIISANATRVNALPAQVDEAVLEDCSVVLVDGHYMQACQVWSRAARARGIRVVLDGGSWKDGTLELLKSVDTAICSADFMPPGCLTEADVLQYLKDCGVTNIAITKGAEPVRFVSDATSGIVPVPQVKLVDTMGAGDIFHGAFCYYASIGRGFVEALRQAARVATESCRFHGTRAWMKGSKIGVAAQSWE
ncbi:MAG: PfkB family carbohydrate kinase [Terracidiphilus sp.]